MRNGYKNWHGSEGGTLVPRPWQRNFGLQRHKSKDEGKAASTLVSQGEKGGEEAP